MEIHQAYRAVAVLVVNLVVLTCTNSASAGEARTEKGVECDTHAQVVRHWRTSYGPSPNAQLPLYGIAPQQGCSIQLTVKQEIDGQSIHGVFQSDLQANEVYCAYLLAGLAEATEILPEARLEEARKAVVNACRFVALDTQNGELRRVIVQVAGSSLEPDNGCVGSAVRVCLARSSPHEIKGANASNVGN